VKLLRIIAAASVVLALVLACASLDSQGLRTMDEDSDDAGSVIDDTVALEATDQSPVLPPPGPGRGVSIDDRIPVARLVVAEVFRPPQARA